MTDYPPSLNSTITPPLVIITSHGYILRNWPVPPRVGDLIRMGDHRDEVVEVEWSDDAVTIVTDCIEGGTK